MYIILDDEGKDGNQSTSEEGIYFFSAPPTFCQWVENAVHVIYKDGSEEKSIFCACAQLGSFFPTKAR